MKVTRTKRDRLPEKVKAVVNKADIRKLLGNEKVELDNVEIEFTTEDD